MSTQEFTENIYLNDNTLTIDGRVYYFSGLLGHGKSAVSSLYECSDRKVVLKQFIQTEQNNIPIDYAMDFELLSYQRIKDAGIDLPKLTGICRTARFLVKEYIPGPVMADYVVSKKVSDSIFEVMFRINSQLQKAGFHIDYFPSNFVLSNNRMYCIDYEAHPYNSQWDFINWGIYFWLNSEGIKKYFSTDNLDFICEPGSFIPYKDDFMRERNRLLSLYN